MAIQPVFRFVSLRGPQKISSHNSNINFINLISEFDYDDSTFFTTLVDQLDETDPYELLVGEAETFYGDASAYESIEDIDSDFVGFADYYYSKQTTLSTLTASTLTTDVTALLSGNIVTYLADAGNQTKIEKLIDTLIADTILDINSEKRNHISAVLVILHIAVNITKVALVDAEVSKIFYATITLPAPLFPLPYPAYSVTPSPSPPPVDYDALRADLKEEFELNQATLNAILTFIHENTLKYGNYASIELGTVPDVEEDRKAFLLDYIATRSETGDTDKLTETQWDSLDTEYQTYLEELKLGEDVFRIKRAIEILQEEAEKLKKQFAGTVKSTKTVVAIGGSIHEIDDRLNQSVVYAYDPELQRGDCIAKPFSVGVLRVVNQEGPCYQPGEIAHIENIMIGETRDRSTRRFDRTEDTTTISTETETENERTHQTTERFELQKETANQIQNQTQFSAGLNITASWGPVSVNSALNFATSTSSQESNQQSTTYAKETIDKSVSRILERVKQERKLTIIHEYEETISQQYTNPKSDDLENDEHQVGIYRWIDKEFKCTVQNYGKRLFYEFMVPEPAAFHLYMKQNKPTEGMTLQKPSDPTKEGIKMIDGSTITLTSFDVLDENNYGYFVSAYNVTGVEPPPPLTQIVSLAINNVGADNTNFTASKNEIKVPKGYFASYAEATGGTDWGDFIMLAIGSSTMGFGALVGHGSDWHVALSGETDVVPVSYWSGKNNDDQVVYLNINVKCQCSVELKQAWKLKTFEAIMNAYFKLKQTYDEAINEMKSQMAFTISEIHPAYKREIEKQELKKGALRIASKKSVLPIGAFNAMSGTNECGYPEFDVCDSMLEGKHVRFLEEAFDWGHMTYTFYPYYYAKVCKWKEIYQLEDSDFLFNQFLKAGYGRVMVPVTPGMEKHLIHYIQTGQIWEGEIPPAITDEYIKALLVDLSRPVEEDETEGLEPWMITLPSNLVALQCESGCIDEDGLPCLIEGEEE